MDEGAIVMITNDGPEITQTNYFQLEHARRGFLYLSGNANAWRLLVPDASANLLTKIRGARRATIRKTNDAGRAVAQILIFDDAPDPYGITLSVEQIDREISPPGDGRMVFYVEDPTTPGAVRKVLDIPCRTL